jgi:hypothetical protein
VSPCLELSRLVLSMTTVILQQVVQRATAAADQCADSSALCAAGDRSDPSAYGSRRANSQDRVRSGTATAIAAIVAIVRLPVITRARCATIAWLNISATIAGLRVIALTRNAAIRV